MKNLDQYNVIEIKYNESIKVNGGSFGYDAGWFIYWSIAGMGVSGAVYAEAVATYAHHYL